MKIALILSVVGLVPGLSLAAAYVDSPDPVAHSVDCRAAQLVPSLAVATNGRLWVTWYAGPAPAEDYHNYVVLATSEDRGESWREVWTADPDGAGPRRPFDPEVFTCPDGTLRWTWCERDCSAGAQMSDEIQMVTLPDACAVPDKPVQPVNTRMRGVMMCKPTFLSNGDWLFPVSLWKSETSSGFYASTDGGNTFSWRGGASMPAADRQFDEHMAVERRNGDLWVWSRCRSGLRTALSHDKGQTWTPLEEGPVRHASSRLFIRRLASGNLLLVKHLPLDENKGRRELGAWLSEDDGETWKGPLVLDGRPHGLSYPSGEQAADGTIWIAYDFDRYHAREIWVVAFTEAEVLAGRPEGGAFRYRRPISKGFGRGAVSRGFLDGREAPVVHSATSRWYEDGRLPQGAVSTAEEPGGRRWRTFACLPKDRLKDGKPTPRSRSFFFSVLQSSEDGGETWTDRFVCDPDEFWPRTAVDPDVSVSGGFVRWSWTDRNCWDRDRCDQRWQVKFPVGELPGSPPEPTLVSALPYALSR